MKTVLISEPNASTSLTFLPYVWGILKTSSEQVSELRGQILWLDPIFERHPAEVLLGRYNLNEIDVLGLSCYTWNFDLQCEIAAIAKAANPSCLTVAGGPHPQIKDPDFFRNNPYFDAVATKDGEETFNALLLALCSGDGSIGDVPGLYLPDGPDRNLHYTGAPRLPNQFSASPYIAQSDYYEQLMASDPSRHYAAIWETTRGCPYSCSFCDWGSNTMSKIRKFEMERIDADIKWIISNAVDSIFSTDANFGIFPRDIDITDMIVNYMKDQEKYKFIYYSPAKNNPERSLAISQKLMTTGINYNQSLPIQHTVPEVLESVDRKNISPQKQYEVARRMLEVGMPVDAQMIIGLPGDTYHLWKTSLAQLAEWGLHEDHSIFFFNLLPNAPAADQSYRKKWEIETIRRIVRDPSGRLKPDGDSGIHQEIIIGSKNFSTDDWIEMNLYSSTFRALHCSGITRLVAVALRKEYGIGFLEFYEFVIEEYVAKSYRGSALRAYARDIYEHLIANDHAIADQATVPELDDDMMVLSVPHALLVRIAMDLDNFLVGLGDALMERFPELDPALFASLMQYQRNMLALPDYEPAHGKRFASAHDWPAYFSRALRADAGDSALHPEPVVGLEVQIEDELWTTGTRPRGASWVQYEGLDRWRSWAEFSMDHNQKVNTIMHQKVSLVPVQVIDSGVTPIDWSRRLRRMLPIPVVSAARRTRALWR